MTKLQDQELIVVLSNQFELISARMVTLTPVQWSACLTGSERWSGSFEVVANGGSNGADFAFAWTAATRVLVVGSKGTKPLHPLSSDF